MRWPRVVQAAIWSSACSSWLAGAGLQCRRSQWRSRIGLARAAQALQRLDQGDRQLSSSCAATLVDPKLLRVGELRASVCPQERPGEGRSRRAGCGCSAHRYWSDRPRGDAPVSSQSRSDRHRRRAAGDRSAYVALEGPCRLVPAVRFTAQREQQVSAWSACQAQQHAGRASSSGAAAASARSQRPRGVPALAWAARIDAARSGNGQGGRRRAWRSK